MKLERCRRTYAVDPKAHRYWSRWPDLKDIGDRELFELINEMTGTLLGFLDQDDADILSRSDLQGQIPAQIAQETGRTNADVAARLSAARLSLCRFIILTLKPLENAEPDQSMNRGP